MNSLQKNRLVTMKGNCAVDFLKKVQKVTSSKPPGSSDESHSTSRLGKTGSDMYQKRRNMLARLPGLDDECFKVLRDIDMVIMSLLYKLYISATNLLPVHQWQERSIA